MDTVKKAPLVPRLPGRPKQKQKVHSTCLYFEESLYKAAVALAFEEGQSLTKYIESLVESDITKREKIKRKEQKQTDD